MRFAVILCCDKTMLHIPAAWCGNFDLAVSMNQSINKNIKRRIFFSPDESKSPNFKLPLAETFDENHDACYTAKILKVFNTFDEAYSYLQKKRNVFPAVYNPKRLNQRLPPLVDENIEAMIKKETKPLLNAIRYANTLIGVQDLTADDDEEFAEMFTIDDDDDANPADIEDDTEIEYQPNPSEHDDYDDEIMSLGYSESDNELNDHEPSSDLVNLFFFQSLFMLELKIGNFVGNNKWSCDLVTRQRQILWNQHAKQRW